MLLSRFFFPVLYDLPAAIQPLIVVGALAAMARSRVLLALMVCVAIYQSQGDTTTVFEWAVFSIILLALELWVGKLGKIARPEGQ